MHKLLIATAALLALSACNAYVPDDRIAGHLSPACTQFPTIDGCQTPAGLERVGTLLVVPVR